MPENKIESPQVRVARGIALFDEKVPGWVDNGSFDDIDGLTVLSGNCPAARAAGTDFGQAMRMFGITFEKAAQSYGFWPSMPRGFAGDTDFGDDADVLDDEWRRQVSARKAQ